MVIRKHHVDIKRVVDIFSIIKRIWLSEATILAGRKKPPDHLVFWHTVIDPRGSDATLLSSPPSLVNDLISLRLGARPVRPASADRLKEAQEAEPSPAIFQKTGSPLQRCGCAL